MQVLELQPQVIKALKLPKPTDPAYPRYPNGRPGQPDTTVVAAGQPNAAVEQQTPEMVHQHDGHDVRPLQ
jgi:hypothetical protein